MLSVYEEFEAQLERWEVKYRGRPRELMIRLFLLSLEREQLVVNAYDEDFLRERIARMPLAPPVRSVVQHALLWILKDEEMHAVFVRGALFKLGELGLRLKAVAEQLGGAFGGWASAVQQHLPWRMAPLTRLLAVGVIWLGRLAGKVPRAVRRQLNLHSFRDFALFNVEAERTAALCWNRLAAIERTQPQRIYASVAEFERIRDDEDRHRRVFEIFSEVLDDHDALREGESCATLVERLGAVGEEFLPPALRVDALHATPLGTGGVVACVQGKPGDDKARLLVSALEAAGLFERLAARAAALGKPLSTLRVAVKASFMLGYHRQDRSPLTDPELLSALAAALRTRGIHDLQLVDCPNLYDKYYQHRSVPEVLRYFDVALPDYDIRDLEAEREPHRYRRGLGVPVVARSWRDADVRLSFAKLRSHPVEHVHLSLPNLEGTGARCEEFLFAERQAHREGALMTVLGEFPPDFAIIDAFENVPDGILGVLGAPVSQTPRRLYAGADALAVDLTVARHVGLKDPSHSPLLRAAIQWFGDPRPLTRVAGVDTRVSPWRGSSRRGMAGLLSAIAYPVYVMASLRGALFVPHFDEQAFPPVSPPSTFVRLARALIQRAFGLRLRR